MESVYLPYGNCDSLSAVRTDPGEHVLTRTGPSPLKAAMSIQAVPVNPPSSA